MMTNKKFFTTTITTGSGPIALLAAVAMLAAFAAGTARASAKITAIDFKDKGDHSELTIKSDSPITPTRTDGANNQVVLEFSGAQLKKGVGLKLDTSSFNSNVSLVSPYQIPKADGQPDTVRVVVQLRAPGDADLTTEGGSTRLSIPNPAGGAASAKAVAGSAPDAVPDAAPGADDVPAAPEPAASVPTPTDVGAPSTTAGADDAAGPRSPRLEEFAKSQAQRRFTGRPITLQFRDADLVDVFRLIADASGFNILVGDDVRGKITLSLAEVPWDQALDVILHTQRLGAERSGNLLRIVTLANLTSEKQEELNAKLLSEANVPRVTRVFPISYADLAGLTAILQRFVTPPPTGGAASASSGNLALVQADARTNSLIVRDSLENLEKMKKLIEILDTQTPQVMIEAKIIEATETFTKSMGGSLGLGKDTGDNRYFTSFAGGNPLDSLVGNGGSITGAGASALSKPNATTSGGAFGLSPTLGFLPGISRLNAFLAITEAEGAAKVIASPKLVVLNKESATIVQSTPVLVAGTTTVAGVGTVPTSTVSQANLSLNVTPTVTNEGSVQMTLAVTRDVPQNGAVGNRNINTKVLVESGSTLVIGGIYTMSTEKRSAGFPVLRKIPIIGALFGDESEDTNRAELFIFITPRILNLKEAGLSS